MLCHDCQSEAPILSGRMVLICVVCGMGGWESLHGAAGEIEALILSDRATMEPTNE